MKNLLSNRMNITQEELKERLKYNPDTGHFIWIKTKFKHLLGQVAGHTQKDGYVKIFLKGRPMSAHRLAWLYMYGELPSGEIDHINHIRDDNRKVNLRVVTRLENHQNKKMDKRNSSGVQGVHWNKGYFENFEEDVKIRNKLNWN